jgi:hypothetical protein
VVNLNSFIWQIFDSVLLPLYYLLLYQYLLSSSKSPYNSLSSVAATENKIQPPTLIPELQLPQNSLSNGPSLMQNNTYISSGIAMTCDDIMGKTVYRQVAQIFEDPKQVQLKIDNLKAYAPLLEE